MVTWGLREAVIPKAEGAVETPFGGVSGASSSLGFLREFDDDIEAVAERRFPRDFGSFSFLEFLPFVLLSAVSFCSTFMLSFSFSRRGRRLPAEVRRGRECLASGFCPLGFSRRRSESTDDSDSFSSFVIHTVSGGSLDIINERRRTELLHLDN